MSLRRAVPAALLLAAANAAVAAAQVQQGSAPAGMLTPATTNAEAAAAFRAGMENSFAWNFNAAARHASRALELDPGFGLARSLRANIVGGPDVAAEYRRGAADAANASAVEALLALGLREVNAGRAPAGRRIYGTAVELAPNDPAVAVWHANSFAGEERVIAYRAVVKKFPSDLASRLWLALHLTPANDSIAQLNGAEAISVAQEAVRLAPRNSESHAIYGHVLAQLRRFDEAKQHLMASTTLEPRSEYGYQLIAQIASKENRQADLRMALDSAIALSPNAGRLVGFRRARALSHLSEKKPQLAMAELAAIAQADEATNKPAAALTHLFMSTVAAAAKDAAGTEQHLQAARDLGATGTTLHDYELGVYTLLGDAAKARTALDNYIRVNGPRPELSAAVNATRSALVHRMTGQVLLTEGKAQEAIPELKQGPENPYVTLFMVEAYRKLKNNKEADALLTTFFERGELSFASSAVPVMRYRFGK